MTDTPNPDLRSATFEQNTGVGTLSPLNDWKKVLGVMLVALAIWVVSLPNSFRLPNAYSYGYVWDQAVYAEAAENFVAGRGLMERTAAGVDLPIWKPLTRWPPGYPLLVASVHRLGVPPNEAAIIVSLLSGAVFLVVVSWICTRLFHWAVAMGLAVAAASNSTFVQFTTYGLSEAAFMAAAACSLACLVAWSSANSDSKGRHWLVACGFFAAGTWAIRHLGYAVLGSTGLFIFAWSLKRGSSKAFKNSAIWLVGVLIIAAPVAIRALVMFGSLSPFDLPPNGLSYADAVTLSIQTIVTELTSLGFAGALLSRTSVLVGLLLLAATAIFLFRHRFEQDWLPNFVNRQRHSLLLGLYAFLLVALVIAATSRYFGVGIEGRFFLPIYWVLPILAATVVSETLRLLRLSSSRTEILACMCFMVALFQMRGQVSHLYPPPVPNIEAGAGRLVSEYLKSEVGDDRIVLACRPDLLRYNYGVNARKIPTTPFNDSSIYFRMITEDDVRRAGDEGLLWGVVIDDLVGARAGQYGSWIKEAATQPEKFTELESVPMGENVLLLKYVGTP